MTELWISGAFSRSAVNHNAGAKTAVSNIIMSVTVMVTTLFLMPLFQYTPNVVLCAIIVTAVIGLIDIPAACQIWKIDKFDFVVMRAFFGVIFVTVQDGLAIAVSFQVLDNGTRTKPVQAWKSKQELPIKWFLLSCYWWYKTTMMLLMNR